MLTTLRLIAHLSITPLLALIVAWVNAPPAMAVEQVDVELAIAVDVSGSMSDEEHETQRQGFLNAFEDPQLINAIRSGIRGRIAVTYFEWGDQFSQQVLVPWRIVSDAASARAFRDELATQPRSPIRGTSISGALAFGAKLFENNGIASFRRVIDVSGDGANRTGRHVDEVRDEVVAKGIIINGLPIMLSPMVRRLTHGYGLNNYFEDCVIGGPAAFVFPVLSYTEFSEAIRRKLIIEIGERPVTAPRVVRVADRSPVTGLAKLPGRRDGRKADCQVGRSFRDSW